MKQPVMALRLNRRAIGVALMTQEVLTMTDGRHLTSVRDRALPAARRWVERWLQQADNAAIVLDIPALVGGSVMKAVVDDLIELLATHGLVVLQVTKPQILTAYGLTPARSRREVRDTVSGFWPQLSEVAGRVKPYVADAAAAALWAECRLTLDQHPV